jgi:hypothetical protein
MKIHLGVGRQIEFLPRAGLVTEPQIVIEEIELLGEPYPRRCPSAVDAAVHAHVLGRGLEQHRCLPHVGAAPPQPDGSGVT